MTNQEMENVFEKFQRKLDEKLTTLPKPEPFVPYTNPLMICGGAIELSLVLPKKQFIFHSPQKRETWTPITGEYKKYQIWAVDLVE